ncbi:hypothetical protein PENTCL1PPCAC_1002, partial [Pristionchus entomophagus]
RSCFSGFSCSAVLPSNSIGSGRSSRAVQSLWSGSSDGFAPIHPLLSGRSVVSRPSGRASTSQRSGHPRHSVLNVSSLRSMRTSHSSHTGWSIHAAGT